MPPGINRLSLPSHSTTSSDARQAIASHIVELAQAHGMTLSKNADLAALLTALQITDPIPIAAFAVVADVLFAILNANQFHHADREPIL
jgi:type III secretion system FlhB-like substrate exporter